MTGMPPKVYAHNRRCRTGRTIRR